MWKTARQHWPEYLMEAAELGTFMVSAAVFASILQHPGSPVRAALPDDFVRRALMGLLMGATAISIVHSPWGRRSGAHFNPAITLTFLRLGKIAREDAFFYCAAHFVGASAGIAIAALTLPGIVPHPTVNYVQTLPGSTGAVVAVAAEIAISCILMLTILTVSNRPALARHTPLFAGALVALFITFEDPLSGMSMNPARSFGPAILAGAPMHLWIYFVGPLAGMFGAAELYRRVAAGHPVMCAKLHHHNKARCIFRCGYHEEEAARAAAPLPAPATV